MLKEGNQRGVAGKYVITPEDTTGQAPLAVLITGERLMAASLARASCSGEFDSRELVRFSAREQPDFPAPLPP